MDRIKYTILAIMLSLASVSAYAKTITVNIQDFAFNPTPLTIDLGDIVKWVNKDPAFHTTTEDTSNLWSANLAPGLSFARAFKTAGKFTYHCAIHPGMMGSIIVRTPEETRINIGKNIVTGANAVLPITLKKTTDQVYQGSYIVNAQGSCADCHSCPTYKVGRNPFKGEKKQFNSTTYLAGGVAFGPFVSRNITPDIHGKPAGFSLAEFKSTLRTGHAPDDAPGTTLQVMPWPIVGQMSDTDLEAIYAYLQSIPPAQTPKTFCTNPGQ